MNQAVCNYAPLRFLPYRDVGEFMNIGVVVHCPQTGYFGYRTLAPEETGRVKGFFPDLDLHIFTSAIEGITRELKRIQSEHHPLENGYQLPFQTSKAQMDAFAGLVRKREGLLFFGDAGTLLASDGPTALDILFARYVRRPLSTNPNQSDSNMAVGSIQPALR